VSTEPKKKKKDSSNKENVDKPQKRAHTDTAQKPAKKQKLSQENGTQDRKDTKYEKATKTKRKVKNKPIPNGVKKPAENTKNQVKQTKELLDKTKNIKKTKEKPLNNKPVNKESAVVPEYSKPMKSKPSVVVNKVKNFQKKTEKESSQKKVFDSPKKVKFVLKNNSMQGTVDYYKSVRQSPSIPFDSSKKPSKTNLKPSSPSPINPFFKKKLRIK
jgi:ribosomal RNA-processing protein 1